MHQSVVSKLEALGLLRNSVGNTHRERQQKSSYSLFMNYEKTTFLLSRTFPREKKALLWGSIPHVCYDWLTSQDEPLYPVGHEHCSTRMARPRSVISGDAVLMTMSRMLQQKNPKVSRTLIATKSEFICVLIKTSTHTHLSYLYQRVYSWAL